MSSVRRRTDGELETMEDDAPAPPADVLSSAGQPFHPEERLGVCPMARHSQGSPHGAVYKWTEA